MTTINTTEVRRLLEGVTEGPWTEHDAGFHPNPYVCGAETLYFDGEVLDRPVVAYVVGMNTAQNKRFIAASRDLIPALVNEIDRLTAENAKLKEIIRLQSESNVSYDLDTYSLIVDKRQESCK